MLATISPPAWSVGMQTSSIRENFQWCSKAQAPLSLHRSSAQFKTRVPSAPSVASPEMSGPCDDTSVSRDFARRFSSRNRNRPFGREFLVFRNASPPATECALSTVMFHQPSLLYPESDFPWSTVWWRSARPKFAGHAHSQTSSDEFVHLADSAHSIWKFGQNVVFATQTRGGIRMSKVTSEGLVAVVPNVFVRDKQTFFSLPWMPLFRGSLQSTSLPGEM